MNVDGRWINQNGSTVHLEAGPEGTLGGTYVSRKGRAARGLEYPIVGQVNDDVLAFQVDWSGPDQNLHAITSFTGRCFTDAQGRESIHTVWVLVRQFEDPEMTKPSQVWNSFLTNSDVFVRDA